jgi:two-component system, NarL family, nitrate/nitrite response regulator NarL
VLVVAEIRLFRDALAEILRRVPDIEVVGASADDESALEVLNEVVPDVVLLDAQTPEAVHAIRRLAAAHRGLKVVAIAVPELEAEIIGCAEAGVAGYVTEDAGVTELVDAVRCVARGEMLCSPRVAATLLRRVTDLASEREVARPAARLTSREVEVVSLIHEGLSNKEIAHTLSIELSTVKNHVHNILEKLGARRRGEAAARVGVLGSRSRHMSGGAGTRS